MTQITFVEPNMWVLSGNGIHVRYSNIPIPGPAGGPHLTYHDGSGVNKKFSGVEIRSVLAGDLGTLISVTLNMTIDTGSTTFTVLLPNVNIVMHGPVSSTAVSTEAITTTHEGPLSPPIGQGQREFYRVTAMTGTASHVMAE